MPGGRPGRVGGRHLPGEQERLGRHRAGGRPGPSASVICSTESATWTVPGPCGRRGSPRDRPVERPVDLDRRRVELERPHAAGDPAGHVVGVERAADRGRARRRRRPPRGGRRDRSPSAVRTPAARPPRDVDADDLGVAPDLAAEAGEAAASAWVSRRRRPRAPGSRRSGRASSSAAPSGRSRGRRAGCRRGRRCRPAGAAAPRRRTGSARARRRA